jgi:parallel beta-helix repeat protein
LEALERRLALASVTVGSGGTYADLNSALADAVNVPAGSTISVLPGTYTAAKSVQNLFQALYRIDRPLTIRAADPTAVTKLALPDFSADPIKPDSVVKIAADGVTIDGLTLDGGAGVWAGVLAQNHANLSVTNNRMGAGVENGLILLGVSQATVSANVIDGPLPQRGVWISSGQSLTVTGNTIGSAAAGGPMLDGVFVGAGATAVTVQGNTITKAGTGIYVTEQCPAVVLAANTVSTSTAWGIYVNDRSHDAAIIGNTATASGDNGIVINGGSLRATITGNTVIGAGQQGIIVTGAGHDATVSENTIASVTGSGVYVNAGSANAKVTGNRITSSGTNGITINGAGSGTTVRGNTIANPGNQGILVTGQSDGAVIAGNTITAAAKSGIYVQNSADAAIGGTAGDRNTVTAAIDNGIVVENGPRAVVTNNKVSAAGKQAILVTTGSANAQVRGNEISAPGVVGVYVAKQSTDVTVDANTITDSLARGVVVDDGCHRAVVTANQIARTGFEGIFVTNASNGVRVEANTVQSTSAAGIYVDKASTGIALRSNAVSDTGKDGIALIGGIDDGFVTGNVLQRSGVNGIHVSGSNRLWLQDNTITDSGNLPSPGGGFEGSGIYLANASTGNFVVRNVVSRVKQDSGIIVNGGSNGNAIVANRLDSLGFSGVLVVDSSFNQIEGNTVVDPRIEGYVLTLNATHNVVRFNSVTYSAYSTAGAGLWVNDLSRYNRLSMNYARGSAENGIAVFQSSFNYIDGNTTEKNKINGVYITRFAEADDPQNSTAEGIPRGNVVVGNSSLDDLANGRLIVRGGEDTEFSRNFAFTTDRRAGTSGFVVDGASSDARFFGNSFVNLDSHGFVIENSRKAVFVRNRFLQTSQAQANPGVAVAWDGGPALGGNFWSQFAAGGNPSNGSTPFTDFVPVVTPSSVDTYPFQAESLGYAATVSIFSPLAGTTMAPGSNRTISWSAPAATWVEIAVVGPGGVVPIAAKAPNTGLYWWQVPADLSAGDYAVRITPLNDAGSVLGPAATSGGFRVEGDALRSVRFASPLQDVVVAAGSTIRAAWTGTGITAVDFDVQVDGGAWQTVASGVTAPYADVPLPAVSSRGVRLRVRDSATGISDTMDGTFTVSMTAAAFATSPTGTVAVGSQQRLDWVSPTRSSRVKLEYTDSRGQPTTIVSDMMDVRSYTWMVPDAVGTTTLTISFLRADGTLISKVTSPTFIVPGQGATVRFIDPGAGALNMAPTGVAISAMSVAENKPAGTAVGTFTTTDTDAGDTFTYSLVPGAGSADNGSFTIDGGVLKTATSFDFEAKSSYSVRVRSTDQGGLSTETSFTITVTDVVAEPLLVKSITPPAAGSYKGREVATFVVNLSRVVTVSGKPQLQLRVGSATRTATYVGGSGTPRLTFQYTVGTKDYAEQVSLGAKIVSASRLIKAGTDKLADALPAGVAGAVLGGVRFDAVAPKVVGRVQVPGKATYGVGQALDFVVTFSEGVFVNGNPSIAVNGMTTGARQAAYLAGSGTNRLTFRYVVQAGDALAPKKTLSLGKTISLVGASIADRDAKNPARVSFSPPSLSGVRIASV